MKNNKLKKVTIILLILLITMIAFLGVYTQDKNVIKNNIKDYQYAMDLSGKRVVTLELDTTNSEESKTEENYQLAKEIIEKRLNSLNVKSYTVKYDDEIGNIVVEIPENNETENIIDSIKTVGKLEITDTESGEVLLNNEDIKKCESGARTTEQGYVAFISIEFKDKAKYEEITKTYASPADSTGSADSENEDKEETEATASESEETANEETNSTEAEKSEANNAENENKEEANKEEKASNKTITMKLDDTEIMSTSFKEPVTDGKMILTAGQTSTTKEALNQNLEYANSVSAILSNPNLPLKYNSNGNIYVSAIQKNTITDSMISYLTLSIVVAAGILIGKYKIKGLFATTANIGFVALLLIIVRICNVELSTEGVAAMVFASILNNILLNKILGKITNEENKKVEVKKLINSSLIDFSLKVIPLFIIAVFFVFTQTISTISFGMVMFWGLTLIALYNLIITKNLLK